MTVMKYRVREANLSDTSKLHQLVNSAYRGDSSKQGWTTEADILGGQRIDEARLTEILKDPKQTILCLIADRNTDAQIGSEDILGCVCLEKTEDERGLGCYLGMLTINPAAQAVGFGKILLSESEAFAQSWGAKFLEISVIQVRTELIRWYERRGFQATGAVEPFPYGDARFGLPKRDDLHFVMFAKPLVEREMNEL